MCTRQKKKPENDNGKNIVISIYVIYINNKKIRFVLY